MKGRKPVPAILLDPAEHKKSKDTIERRQEAEKELQTSAVLRCPTYLTKEAKREWKRVIKLYREMQVDILSDLDKSTLVIYCEAWSVYKKAQETWSKYNQVVAGNPEAQRVLDRCLNVMEKQQRQISSLAEQLCLTPVGRARMGTAKAKNEPSEIEKFFMRVD